MKKINISLILMLLAGCGEVVEQAPVSLAGEEAPVIVDTEDKDALIAALTQQVTDLTAENETLKDKKCPTAFHSSGGGGGGSSCPVCHDDATLTAQVGLLTTDLATCVTVRDTAVAERDQAVIDRDLAQHNEAVVQENNLIIQADLNQCRVDLDACQGE